MENASSTPVDTLRIEEIKGAEGVVRKDNADRKQTSEQLKALVFAEVLHWRSKFEELTK